jgi:hypothetical protein
LMPFTTLLPKARDIGAIRCAPVSIGDTLPSLRLSVQSARQIAKQRTRQASHTSHARPPSIREVVMECKSRSWLATVIFRYRPSGNAVVRFTNASGDRYLSALLVDR